MTTHTRSISAPATRVNTTTNERYLSSVIGAAFLAGALIKRSWASLGLAAIGASFIYRSITGFSWLYKLLGRNRAILSKMAAVSVPHEAGIRVERSVTINRPLEEVFGFWRNFGNLPAFMDNLESVEVFDDKHSHWIVAGPAGLRVEWDAVIVNEQPNEHIAWRSLNSADVDNAGAVHFRPAPGDRGTEVHVVLEYAPVAGRVGARIAELFRSAPDQQIATDLYRFKQIMETGEIATIDGQPSGRK